MAINYQSVLDQLTAHGLDVRELVADGKTHRCKVDGSRDKPGWYLLHDITLERGDRAIVGAFGIWRGSDNGAQKVDLNLPELSPEQKKAIRDQMRADAKRVEAQRAAETKHAAARAAAMWKRLSEDGDSEYLARKRVGAHGVRFSPSGSLYIPMCDNAGAVWGLQAILPKGSKRIARTRRDKEFWPAGHEKKGKYHLIGLPTWVVLVAEGYATAATLHEATGLPVAVAFDAGNLSPVVDNLRKRYPKVKVLICADDDRFGRCQWRDETKPKKEQRCVGKIDLLDDSPTCPTCGHEHGVKNTGRITAANIIGDGIQWIVPRFDDQDARRAAYMKTGSKLSDFNDLRVTETLAVVRDQIDAALAAFGWTAPEARRALQTEGSGDCHARRAAVSTMSLEDVVDRFIYVDDATGDFVFDNWTASVVKVSKVKSLLPAKARWDEVKDHPTWRSRAVYIDQIGFDPSGEDPDVICNRWSGWPTKPKAGQCDRLLDLLRYLVSGEQNAVEVFYFIIKWLAYPIQYPGAKMQSAIVVHGPQGTGKSRFFEAYAKIFGEYSIVLNQGAIEDKFNSDWSERKLFVLADEIVARSDMYHLKNQLKTLITGEWVRVNPKNVAAHRERNHMNIVFASNEKMPVVLENDDRRHLIFWTPPPLSREFFDEVDAEIDAGGVEALHDYLLNLDLGSFKPWTHPPMTRSKRELIHRNKESVDLFLEDWQAGDIDDLPFCPCGSSDLYDAYAKWCRRFGVKNPRPSNQFTGDIIKMPGWFYGHKDRYRDMQTHVKKRQRMVVPDDAALRSPPWNAINDGNGHAFWPAKYDSQTAWLTAKFFEFHLAMQGESA